MRPSSALSACCESWVAGWCSRSIRVNFACVAHRWLGKGSSRRTAKGRKERESKHTREVRIETWEFQRRCPGRLSVAEVWIAAR